ncbi:hypothetical protein B6J45_28840 [Klebsiella pneumoniae]|nr:hypothetical protein B6J45_28840 [Klebsiella pneumoniae]
MTKRSANRQSSKMQMGSQVNANTHGEWKVGNIYSALPHDAILSEATIKELVKAGKVLKG